MKIEQKKVILENTYICETCLGVHRSEFQIYHCALCHKEICSDCAQQINKKWFLDSKYMERYDSDEICSECEEAIHNASEQLEYEFQEKMIEIIENVRSENCK